MGGGRGGHIFSANLWQRVVAFGDLLLEFLQMSVGYKRSNMDNGLSLQGDQVQLYFILFILPR